MKLSNSSDLLRFVLNKRLKTLNFGMDPLLLASLYYFTVKCKSFGMCYRNRYGMNNAELDNIIASFEILLKENNFPPITLSTQNGDSDDAVFQSAVQKMIVAFGTFMEDSEHSVNAEFIRIRNEVALMKDDVWWYDEPKGKPLNSSAGSEKTIYSYTGLETDEDLKDDDFNSENPSKKSKF